MLHAAEGLWLQTLDEARKRATAEQGSRKTALTKDAQDLEIRSHVLSIRESELRDRIAQAEGRASQLEIEIEALTTLLRKEQASRLAVERRLVETQSGLQQAPRRGSRAGGRRPTYRLRAKRNHADPRQRQLAPGPRQRAQSVDRNDAPDGSLSDLMGAQGKATIGEDAQRTWQYVSIPSRFSTQDCAA